MNIKLVFDRMLPLSVKAMPLGKNIQRTLNILIFLVFSLYAIFLLMRVALGIDKNYQWDFKAHYYAAHVDEQGLNFYDEPYLRHFGSPDVEQFYSYTPPSIWFFRFFSLFPYSTAYVLFFTVKLLALAGLFFLWKKIFLEMEADIGFLVFALLAFNGALYLDLMTGNVSLLEQLGLWLGFFFLLKKKPVLFGLCVVLIATFKVVPLAFLVLLLFLRERKKILYFCGSLLGFAALQAASWAVNPFLFKEFLKIFFSMLWETRGITNPSTFVWLQDLVRSFYPRIFGGTAPRFLAYGLFIALAALIGSLTWKALRRLRSDTGRESEKAMILLACLAYALLLPRFKDYSYVLLIVPAYFALKKYAAGLGRVFLFGLAVLSIPENTNLPGFTVIFHYIWEYFPLLTAVVVWLLFLRRAFRPQDVPLSAPLPA